MLNPKKIGGLYVDVSVSPFPFDGIFRFQSLTFWGINVINVEFLTGQDAMAAVSTSGPKSTSPNKSESDASKRSRNFWSELGTSFHGPI